MPDTAMLQAFGSALLEERTRHGLTQTALGKILQVDASTIGHWERGHFRPSQPCYEAILRWAPKLKKHPLPDTFHDQKPPGWAGSHDGISPAVQPATRAAPNRVKAKVREVGEALHRADSAQAKAKDARSSPICSNCGDVLRKDGTCPNMDAGGYCTGNVQLPLPLPGVATEKPRTKSNGSSSNAAAQRLLKKYAAFIGSSTSLLVRQSLLEFLREADGNELSLKHVIEVIEAAT